MIRLPIEPSLYDGSSVAHVEPEWLVPTTPTPLTDATTKQGVDAAVSAGPAPARQFSAFAPDRLKSDAAQMVNWLQREFDLDLTLARFFGEPDYAKDVIRLGLTSRDARVRGYATFLDMQMFGAPVPP